METDASIFVAAIVRDAAWELVRAIDSDQVLKVASLHTRDVDPRTGSALPPTANSSTSFGVNHEGGWVEISQQDGEKRVVAFSGQERISTELLKMLHHRPDGLRSRLSEWPVEDSFHAVDELWELVPWRQAVRSGLRTRRRNWTQLAVDWVAELDVADEFADDLIESASESMGSLRTDIRRRMLRLAGLTEPDTLVSYAIEIDPAALTVAAMVTDEVWQRRRHEPSGEIFEVAALHHSPTSWTGDMWFGVSRRGSWIETSRSEVGFCTSFWAPDDCLTANQMIFGRNSLSGRSTRGLALMSCGNSSPGSKPFDAH